MNCFTHIMTPAVAQCKNCGKFLCKECATKYPDMICGDCAYALEDKERSRRTRRNLYAITLFCVMVVLGLCMGYEREIYPMWQIILGSLFAGYFVAGIPFGWYALRRFRIPDNIIIINLVFIVILGFIKFYMSVMIGWLVLLLHLLKSLFATIKRKF